MAWSGEGLIASYSRHTQDNGSKKLHTQADNGHKKRHTQADNGYKKGEKREERVQLFMGRDLSSAQSTRESNIKFIMGQKRIDY